jgi:hypothetical protein
VSDVKKSKRAAPIQPDERRPTKEMAPHKGARPAAEIPTYDGARKTDAMPRRRRGQRDRVKEAFKPETGRRSRSTKEVDLADQKPRRRSAGRAGAGAEQYIRLRIRVRKGRLSVVDSHLVDGPLGQVTGFPGSHAYEVTLDGRLLHAGALPDLGVQRSFPNLHGPPLERGHYITERDTYEFAARLPADEVTSKTIGKIAIRLLRVKEETGAARLAENPLSEQFERELRPVAELVGLPRTVLPAAIEKRGARTPNVQ